MKCCPSRHHRLYFPQRRYCALQLRDWSRGQVESAAEASAAMPSMLYDDSMISTMVDVGGLGLVGHIARAHLSYSW